MLSSSVGKSTGGVAMLLVGEGRVGLRVRSMVLLLLLRLLLRVLWVLAGMLKLLHGHAKPLMALGPVQHDRLALVALRIHAERVDPGRLIEWRRARGGGACPD